MIKIDREIIKAIGKYRNLYSYCRLVRDDEKENELEKINTKIYMYFDKLNSIEYEENTADNYFYSDFYLSHDDIETIISFIGEKIKNEYEGEFYLYSDKEIFYTMFNEKNSKDEIIINLLEQINNPVEYMMFNLFLEPSSLYWCGKIFEIKHNVILSTEKIKLYSYKKQE